MEAKENEGNLRDFDCGSHFLGTTVKYYFARMALVSTLRHPLSGSFQFLQCLLDRGYSASYNQCAA